jgi:hypothetical protein
MNQPTQNQSLENLAGCQSQPLNQQHQELTDSAEAAREKRAKEAREWYHRNKAEINARRYKKHTDNLEESKKKQNERYKRKREALGFTVKTIRPIGSVTPEMKKADSLATCKRWRDKHREKLRVKWRETARAKKLLLDYGDIVKQKSEYDKMYRQRERHGKRKQWNTEYLERHKDNVHFRLARRLRARVRMAIIKSYGEKSLLTMDLIGCTVGHVKEHLEKQFTDGMTWEAFLRGEIHIDHIQPCSSFDLADVEQQKICFSWQNLQPLWAIDNLKKSNKVLAMPSDNANLAA